MTNQRRILGILWYVFVTNDEEVATAAIHEAICPGRHFLFGRIRRMDQAISAQADHQALHLSVTTRQGSGHFGTWSRQPGRPRKSWAEQVLKSTGLSTYDA